MKLSDKLKQLQKEAKNHKLTEEAIEDGFNRCIEDAEYFELNQSQQKLPSIEEINKQFPLPENGKSGIITGLEKSKRMGAMLVINQLNEDTK